MRVSLATRLLLGNPRTLVRLEGDMAGGMSGGTLGTFLAQSSPLTLPSSLLQCPIHHVPLRAPQPHPRSPAFRGRVSLSSLTLREGRVLLVDTLAIKAGVHSIPSDQD